MQRHVLGTPVGGIELWIDDGRLRALNLTRRTATSDPVDGPIVAQLERYFAGEPVRFMDVALDLRGRTDFEQRVYGATRMIPFGNVASHGQVARAIGIPSAARAVGQARRNNPVAIVSPCHRVIASDGSLGGFSAGLEWKRKLLRHERVLR